MKSKRYVLAIDQGTSSTKTLLFDEAGQALAKGSEPLQTHYFDNGFVEQEPGGIIQNVKASVTKCLQQFSDKGFDPKEIAGIGISNQRETFVVWDRDGNPLHRAVVWQCKRSIGICEQLKQQGLAETIHQKTGLVIDPYFSATKLIWLFKNNAVIKEAIQKGNAFFGTIDSWLLYYFTGGKQYATDFTNASRTMFFNLHSMQWDEELIAAFGLKGLRLPEVRPSSFYFGETNLDGLLPNAVPIAGLIGDSHAAAFGEGCFEPGTAKATLGTGCSILMNIGSKPVLSANGMVSTVCWSTEERTDFALEGVIVSCGATLEWLKNEMNLFSDSRQTEAMATAVSDNGGVYLIPAFSGLGAPYWDMSRKASVTGLTFGTQKNHVVRAALESIPYQIKDIIAAMESDTSIQLEQLMVDGGITSNRFVLQFLADLLEKPIVSIGQPDVSALGAAYAAGLKTGMYEELHRLTELHSDKKVYQPSFSGQVKENYHGWKSAIANCR